MVCSERALKTIQFQPPLSWAGTPFLRPGYSELHPMFVALNTSSDGTSLVWAAYSRVSPSSQQRLFPNIYPKYIFTLNPFALVQSLQDLEKSTSCALCRSLWFLTQGPQSPWIDNSEHRALMLLFTSNSLCVLYKHT